MRKVFVDSLYWIAALRPRDPWAQVAREARVRLGVVPLVTTQEVLGEVLTAVCDSGPWVRRAAAKMVQGLMRNPAVTITPQSDETFRRGLDFYRQREDKEYSLADCVSMTLMRQEGITEVLTFDHHFEQEGFEVLIRSQTKSS